jgi:hypothetical protein
LDESRPRIRSAQPEDMAMAVAVAVGEPPLSVTMSGTQHGSGQLFHSCETGAHNVQRESKRCKTEVFVNRCQKRGQGTGFCFLFSELQLFYYYLLRLGWSLIRYIKRYKFLRKKKKIHQTLQMVIKRVQPKISVWLVLSGSTINFRKKKKSVISSDNRHVAEVSFFSLKNCDPGVVSGRNWERKHAK